MIASEPEMDMKMVDDCQPQRLSFHACKRGTFRPYAPLGLSIMLIDLLALPQDLYCSPSSKPASLGRATRGSRGSRIENQSRQAAHYVEVVKLLSASSGGHSFMRVRRAIGRPRGSKSRIEHDLRPDELSDLQRRR